MPNDGTGVNWDVADPQDVNSISAGATEIRDLRIGVAARVNKEHRTLAGSSAGGEHKQGSAVGFYQTNAPTTTPGGTALGVNDVGRFWVNATNLQITVFNGSTFVPILLTEPGQLVNNVVRTAAIQDGNVTTAKIAANSITNLLVADNAVTGSKIADNVITTAKVVDRAVTTQKIALGAVQTENLADTSVTPVKNTASNRVAVKAYTGNGSATGPIVDFDFAWNLIIISSFASGNFFTGNVGNRNLRDASGTTDLTTGIAANSSGATTIQLTTNNTAVNQNGVGYYVLAFG